MRIGIKFQRKGMEKYVSHLDMQRLFSRALRRSGLPVKYSSGFNPHINLSFASALAVGMESEAEYAEFTLLQSQDTKEVFRALAGALPEGIGLVACGELPEGTKKLMAATKSAYYRIIPQKNEEEFARGLQEIIARDSVAAKKKKEGKIREIDIRPHIYQCKVVNHPKICGMIELALSGEASLSPTLLLQTIEEEQGKPFGASICRTEIYTQTEEGKVPLESLFRNETAER